MERRVLGVLLAPPLKNHLCALGMCYKKKQAKLKSQHNIRGNNVILSKAKHMDEIQSIISVLSYACHY